MNLPAIDIPIPAQLPIEIPLLMHPAVVHFAISLPIILLLIEFINLIMKRKALSVTTVTIIVLIGLIFLTAFFTGRADAKEAFSLLNSDAQAELKFHKLFGIYLVYMTIVVLIFKIVSMSVKKTWATIVYFLILIIFIGLTFFQGKEGGELVYEHGVNVKIVQELKGEIKELQKSQEVKAEPEKEELKAPVQENKEETIKTAVEEKAEVKQEPKEEQTHQEEDLKTETNHSIQMTEEKTEDINHSTE